MSVFAEIFDSTATYLRTQGVAPQIFKGGKASKSALDEFVEQTGFALPPSFVAFHTDFADGYEFIWQKGEEQSGFFVMPSLEQLSQLRRDWEKNVQDFLDDPKSLDRCVLPTFRADAFKIWRQMKSWVPFCTEADGDQFCVDGSSGTIVYDQHDWFDGFGSVTKINGIVAGDSLAGFLKCWSRYCFQPNKSLWWGEFSQFGEIKWEPEYFDSSFVQRWD